MEKSVAGKTKAVGRAKSVGADRAIKDTKSWREGKSAGKGKSSWEGKPAGKEKSSWEGKSAGKGKSSWEGKSAGKGKSSWEGKSAGKGKSSWGEKTVGKGKPSWESKSAENGGLSGKGKFVEKVKTGEKWRSGKDMPDGRSGKGRSDSNRNDRGKSDSNRNDKGRRDSDRSDKGRSDSEKSAVYKEKGSSSSFGRAPKGRYADGQQMNNGTIGGKDRPFEKDNGEKKHTSLCPVYHECGGCQLLHLPYEKQLKQKQQMMEELLKGICPVKPIIGMENPFHYRNKVHAVFDHDRSGNVLSGFYKGGTHFLVPVDSCMIEDEKADDIIRTIKGMLRSFKILTYDEDTGYGFLRHVLIKRGFATGEIMVVLVTASAVFPSKNNFIKALRAKHPEITTIVQNVNDKMTSMVLGEKEHVLFGKGYIEDELCGYRFRISPKSFYQVNPVQAEVLYKKAIELAALTGRETVLDAYCGIGTIGMIASKHAGKVIGVESNSDAVKDAVQNAKRNGVKNIQFYCNDAGRFMTTMAAAGERADVVLMDPPRNGSTEEFIDAVVTMKPERVVYVSCGPESLQRDLILFKQKGYRSVEAWPVDMFAGTRHVESVILLHRKNI